MLAVGATLIRSKDGKGPKRGHCRKLRGVKIVRHLGGPPGAGADDREAEPDQPPPCIRQLARRTSLDAALPERRDDFVHENLRCTWGDCVSDLTANGGVRGATATAT